MSDKPHIVRMVADRARQLVYAQNRLAVDTPRPAIIGEEIGVLLSDGRFISYADLGFHHDLGFYSLSETPELPNEAAPYAALGRLINIGQTIVAAGAAEYLTPDEIGKLVERHATGDFGLLGEFYDIDLSEEMFSGDSTDDLSSEQRNKINTLRGLGPIHSRYNLRGHLILLLTEAGHRRSTLVMYAGAAE